MKSGLFRTLLKLFSVFPSVYSYNEDNKLHPEFLLLVTFIFGLTFLLIIVCGLLCFLCGLWRGRKSAHGLENIKGPPRLKQTVIKMAKRTAVFTNGSKPKAKLHVRKGTNYPSDTDEE